MTIHQPAASSTRRTVAAPGGDEFGDLGLFGVVAARPEVEMDAVLHGLRLGHAQEQEARTDSVGVDDRADRAWRRDRNVVRTQEVFPRIRARWRRFGDVSERRRPEPAHRVGIDTIDRDLERRGHPAYGTAMPIGSLHEIVVDCANPEALARFWQALIGGEVDVESQDWAGLDGDDEGFYIAFQRVTEGKSGKNRVHFDVDVDDLATAVDEAEQLGARKIGAVVDDDDGGTMQAMADPGGNEFFFVLT